MAIKKKVVFYADEQIVNWLLSESKERGAPVGELCRRAVRFLAFGELQTKQWPPKVETR